MVSTSVQLCVVENLGIATEVLHLSRYCWMLKWLMPKAILKWGNQQEAIHQFNCHLFPWPISSNTRRLEYQLLLFKVASHPNSKQLYICCSTQFYLYFSSFFYGRIRLIMPICNTQLQIFVSFCLEEWMIMTLKMELLLCSASCETSIYKSLTGKCQKREERA